MGEIQMLSSTKSRGLSKNDRCEHAQFNTRCQVSAHAVHDDRCRMRTRAISAHQSCERALCSVLRLRIGTEKWHSAAIELDGARDFTTLLVQMRGVDARQRVERRRRRREREQ